MNTYYHIIYQILIKFVKTSQEIWIKEKKECDPELQVTWIKEKKECDPELEVTCFMVVE